MTNQNIVRFEIITELVNQRPSYNDKNPQHRKNCFGRITNGYMYHNNDNNSDGGWMSVSPLQTRKNQGDTPIFAVYEDGSKVKMNSHYFFSNICDEAWVNLKVSDFQIEGKEGDILDTSEEVEKEVWAEEREDRPTAIVWIIPAKTQEEFSACLQRNSVKSLNSGRKVRDLTFRGKMKFVYETMNLRPVKIKQWPLPVVTDEEYNAQNPIEEPVAKPAVSASKAVVKAPIVKAQLEAIAEEQELVVVDEKEVVANSLDELDAFFPSPDAAAFFG